MLNTIDYIIPSNEDVKITPAKVEIVSETRHVDLKEKLLVTENKDLEFVHYVAGKEGRIGFEMLLSTEALSLARKAGWKELRNIFEENISSFEHDPFGEQSIDPSKKESFAQTRRSVNSITQDLEKMIGLPLAIKGTGIGLSPRHPDREDLVSQYKLMRNLQLKSAQVFSDETKEVLEFAPVYGVIKYPVDRPEKYQEWLIMKRYDNAQRVEDHKMRGPVWHRHGLQFAGFDPREHPRFAIAAGSPYGDWAELLLQLKAKGLPVTDLSGRNVLYYPNSDGQNKYAIIDQKVYE